jgi:hypothetical protein
MRRIEAATTHPWLRERVPSALRAEMTKKIEKKTKESMLCPKVWSYLIVNIQRPIFARQRITILCRHSDDSRTLALKYPSVSRRNRVTLPDFTFNNTTQVPGFLVL